MTSEYYGISISFMTMLVMIHWGTYMHGVRYDTQGYTFIYFDHFVYILYISLSYTFCIFRSLFMQSENSLGLCGEFLYVGHSVFAPCITRCSQFERSGDTMHYRPQDV